MGIKTIDLKNMASIKQLFVFVLIHAGLREVKELQMKTKEKQTE